MGTQKIDQGRPAVAAILAAASRGARADLADLEATRGQASARLRERVRMIVERPAAVARITPRSGEVRGPAEWRRHVGEACADLRLTTLQPRPRVQYERALIRATIAECLTIRLRERCKPIFQIAGCIEWKCGRLAAMLREPWAPSSHQVNRELPLTPQ